MAPSPAKRRRLKPADVRLAAACTLILTLAGCASQPTPANAILSQDWTAADYQYRLAPGDELRVRFLLDQDLDTQVTLGPDGRGVFPLIQSLPLSGLTIEAADAALTNAYAKVLRAPQIDTTVVAYSAAQIYVAGEVREPGVKPIKGEMNVTQAVMAAGGFLDTARTAKVVVLRPRGPSRMLMRVVDVDRALDGRESGDLKLLPGDIVFVPRSAIAEVNRIVKQYMTNAVPFTMNYNLDKYRVVP